MCFEVSVVSVGSSLGGEHGALKYDKYASSQLSCEVVHSCCVGVKSLVAMVGCSLLIVKSRNVQSRVQGV